MRIDFTKPMSRLCLREALQKRVLTLTQRRILLGCCRVRVQAKSCCCHGLHVVVVGRQCKTVSSAQSSLTALLKMSSPWPLSCLTRSFCWHGGCFRCHTPAVDHRAAHQLEGGARWRQRRRRTQGWSACRVGLSGEQHLVYTGLVHPTLPWPT